MMYGMYPLHNVWKEMMLHSGKIKLSSYHEFLLLPSGFMLSITCTNHMMAYFATTGSFFPLIFLGGNIINPFYFESYVLV